MVEQPALSQVEGARPTSPGVPAAAAGSPVVVRARRDEDLPHLEQALGRQQPRSGYPVRWPLPFPVVDFIVRPQEIAAWTAVLGADDPAGGGRPVGHVSLTRVEDDDLGRVWAAGAGLPIDRLVCVSALFVDEGLRGSGVGTALLTTAQERAGELGLRPVLDVAQRHRGAAEFYARRGWRIIGRTRPPWLPEDDPDVLLMIAG